MRRDRETTYEFDGNRLTLVDWAIKLNMSYGGIYKRVKKYGPGRRAFSPRRLGGKHK